MLSIKWLMHDSEEDKLKTKIKKTDMFFEWINEKDEFYDKIAETIQAEKTAKLSYVGYNGNEFTVTINGLCALVNVNAFIGPTDFTIIKTLLDKKYPKPETEEIMNEIINICVRMCDNTNVEPGGQTDTRTFFIFQHEAFVPAEIECIKAQTKTSELIATRQKDIALKAIMPN